MRLAIRFVVVVVAPFSRPLVECGIICDQSKRSGDNTRISPAIRFRSYVDVIVICIVRLCDATPVIHL